MGLGFPRGAGDKQGMTLRGHQGWSCAALAASLALGGVSAWAQPARPKPPGAKAPEPPPETPKAKRRLPKADVDVSPNFTRGDLVSVDWRRTSSTPIAKGKLRADTVTGAAQVEVVSADAEQFVIAWTWGHLTYSGQGRTAVGETEVAADLVSGQRFELVLGRDGQMRGLRDLAGLRARLAARLEEVVDARRPALGENPALEQVRQSLADTIADDDLFEGFVLGGPGTFFAALVGKLTTTSQLRADSELPNPWGGRAFPASATVAVLDLAPGKATVGWDVSLKPEHVAAVMEETVRAMQLKGGRKREVPKVLSLSVRSEGEVTVSLGSTWPVQGRETTVVSKDGVRETTTTVWQVRPGG